MCVLCKLVFFKKNLNSQNDTFSNPIAYSWFSGTLGKKEEGVLLWDGLHDDAFSCRDG